jgi:5-methyltetrahydrofolate--homocysteine methyltransferase
LRAAAAAQEAFEVIRENLPAASKSASKGRIVLATVKGDVHDIGKNIVKTLLANYGYEIDDLGKDAAPELILNASRGAKLVGLSALMTTTLKYMEETIKLIKKNAPETKIVVGGAVVTESYAKKINADYYAKDAKSGVDIAKEVFKQQNI